MPGVNTVEGTLELIDRQIDGLLREGPVGLLPDVMEGDREVVRALLAHLPPVIYSAIVTHIVRVSPRTTAHLSCLTSAGAYRMVTTWAQGSERSWVVEIEFTAMGPRQVA
jgi:hypothetical protein